MVPSPLRGTSPAQCMRRGGNLVFPLGNFYELRKPAITPYDGIVKTSRPFQALEKPRPGRAAKELSASPLPAETALSDLDCTKHRRALSDAEAERGAQSCDVLRLKRDINRVARLSSRAPPRRAAVCTAIGHLRLPETNDSKRTMISAIGPLPAHRT